ncbi:MAG TPA: YciI family protein [Candidatus Binataceae bacterium]|jgi:hypothetical protein
MQYMLLLYESEATAAKRSQAEQAEIHRRFMALNQDLSSAGKRVGGSPLERSSTATTVRARDGKTLTTDGPFAETKEQLGGYWIIEAADLKEAIALAARVPTAESGCVEVRPVMKIPG